MFLFSLWCFHLLFSCFPAFFAFVSFHFLKGLHIRAGQRSVTVATLDTNQSFRVYKVHLATLKVATNSVHAWTGVKWRECKSEFEQRVKCAVDHAEKHRLPEAVHRASRRTGRGHTVLHRAHIATEIRLKITSGGVRHAVTCATRRIRTESWSHKIVRIVEKEKFSSARCAAERM